MSIVSRVAGPLVLSLGTAALVAAPPDARPAAPPAGAIVLFDGKEANLLVSTTGTAINWPIDNGALVSTPNGRRSNNLVSRLHFRDAEIHVEFMLPSTGDGNSGVYIHGEYELQILNSIGTRDLGTGDVGAVYGLYKPLVNAASGPGEWQTLDVHYRAPRRDSGGKIADDGTITAWLNGRKIHDRVAVGAKASDHNPYRYDTTPYLAAIARQQRRTGSGPLLLQDHDNPVRFRNIWVKPLDKSAHVYDPSLAEGQHASPPSSR